MEQLQRTTDALVTAANLDNMLTSAHSQIQRLTTERDALRDQVTLLREALQRLTFEADYIDHAQLPKLRQGITMRFQIGEARAALAKVAS